MVNKPMSRVNTKNSSQLTQFKFRWWMVLILVAVVAIIGIVILRFSHAANGFQVWTGADSEWRGTFNDPVIRTTDKTLPTTNKTVLKIASNNTNGTSGYYVNNRISVQKGQTLGFCFFIKLTSYTQGMPYIQLGTSEPIGRAGAVHPILAYDKGEQAEAGYRKFCATTAVLPQTVTYTSISVDVVGTPVYRTGLLQADGYPGSLEGMVWKVETFVQDSFKPKQ